MDKKLSTLYNILRKHDKLYYIDSDPIITDYEYDMLKKEYLILKNKCSDIRKSDYKEDIGFITNNNMRQRKHLYPMLSLYNIFTEEDLERWFNRINKLYCLLIFFQSRSATS